MRSGGSLPGCILLLAAVGLVGCSDKTASGGRSSTDRSSDAVGLPVAGSARYPGGVFSIRGPRKVELAEAPELDSPLIVGLSARFGWDDLEPKAGQYDWTLLEKARELANARKKWLMVRVCAGIYTPGWVYELNGVRSVTLGVEDAKWYQQVRPGTTPRMAVPWDENYLKAWESFLKALGQKVQDWPELYCVQMAGGGFIGEMHVAKNTEAAREQWKAVDASDEKFIPMWQRIISAYHAYMPSHVGIPLNMSEPLQKSNTCQVVYDWALREYPGRVWFQQNGLIGTLTAEATYPKMLRAASATTTVGYQMGSIGGSKGGLRKAFERAIGDNCSYVEVYSIDVLDPRWKDDLVFLAKGLKENHESRVKRQ